MIGRMHQIYPILGGSTPRERSAVQFSTVEMSTGMIKWILWGLLRAHQTMTLPPALVGCCSWGSMGDRRRPAHGKATRRRLQFSVRKLMASGSLSAAPLMQICMHACDAHRAELVSNVHSLRNLFDHTEQITIQILWCLRYFSVISDCIVSIQAYE